MASDSSLRDLPADTRFGWPEFVRLVDLRRGFIIKIALLVVVLTAIAVFLTPSRYNASAVVMLNQQKNAIADSSSVLTTPAPDPAAVQNQIHILTSRDLAAQVVDGQKLTEDPEFNPALQGPGLKARLLALIGAQPQRHTEHARDHAIDAFLKSIDASALGLSTSIEVSVSAHESDKAARLANALAETYVASQIEAKRLAAKNAAAWLNTRIAQLTKQLEDEEIAVERYKRDHDLVDSGQATSLLQQQLGTINTQIVTAQSDLAEKQASLRRAEQLLHAGRPADLSQITSSDLMVKLRSQSAEIVQDEADLSARYGPNHPKLVAVRKQLADLDHKIAQEAARMTGSIANDVAVAQAHLGALRASLKNTETDARGDNFARVTLNALVAKAAITRQTYESFVAKLRGVQDQDAIQTPEASITSHAAPPVAPSSPRRALMIGASVPLGLLLGLLLALIQARMAPAAAIPVVAPSRRVEPVAAPRQMMPPVLAELSGAGIFAAADAVLDAPSSPDAAALAQLSYRLLPRSGMVLNLAAATTDPAQSLLALGLARAVAARGQQTVVIETAPSTLLPWLRQPALGGGLAELMRGRTRLEQAVVRDPRSSLHILPAGQAQGAPEHWLTPVKMERLLAYFRQSGFAVVIDGPPVSSPVAGRLAAMSDCCAFVTQTAVAPDRMAAAFTTQRNCAGLVVLR